MATRIDPVEAAVSDCEDLIAEGQTPTDLARGDADEALINGMGRAWVLRAAGAPDDSEQSWDECALPWCAEYSAAYRAHALSRQS